ncbi:MULTISPECIES: hypothetical protein [unclassified Microcoleus]
MIFIRKREEGRRKREEGRGNREERITNREGAKGAKEEGRI